jgi:hypothetical protein
MPEIDFLSTSFSFSRLYILSLVFCCRKNYYAVALSRSTTEAREYECGRGKNFNWAFFGGLKKSYEVCKFFSSNGWFEIIF